MRDFFILLGSIVTVLLFIFFFTYPRDTIYPRDTENVQMGVNIAYTLIGLPLNIIALILIRKWNQRRSIKWIAIVLNGVPVLAVLLGSIFFVFFIIFINHS